MQSVSVLLPVKTVDSRLQSVLKSLSIQTLRADQIVIVVPSCLIRSVQQLALLFNLEQVVVYVEDPQMGLSGALNAGLSALHCSLVARVDADDECLPHRFQIQADMFARDPQLDVVACSGQTRGRSQAKGRSSGRVLSTQELLFRNPILHSSAMIKTSSLLKANGYNQAALAEDYDLWMRLLSSKARIKLIEQPLINYSSHAGQLSHSVPKLTRAIQIADSIKGNLLPYHPVIGRIACAVWICRGLLAEYKWTHHAPA